MAIATLILVLIAVFAVGVLCVVRTAVRDENESAKTLKAVRRNARVCASARMIRRS